MSEINLKSLHLGVWSLLFEVMDKQSITLAASKLGIERSKLSRLLQGLEHDVGEDLLIRMGKKVRPTLAAVAARKKIEPLLRQMKSAVSSIRTGKTEEKGSIRFGAMPGFLQTQVVPLIAEFQEQHPDITFDVIGDDDPQAFMKGQTDLMLYYGPVNNSELNEFWVTRSAFIPCASPAYLEKFGNPQNPEELEEHKGVLYTGRVRPHSTILQRNGKEKSFRFRSRIRFNNILIAKSAAMEGCGILLDLPLHHCINELMEGSLIPVLDGWHIPNLDNYIACTRAAASLKRVHLFMEWYIQKRRDIESEQHRQILSKYPFVSF